MKTTFSSRPLAAAVLVTALLAGCAPGTPTRSQTQDQRMGMTDMKAMCDMHKKMMSDKSPAERSAMMEDRMKTMSPEQRKQMETMHEQCK